MDYELNGKLFPISNDFNADMASDSQDKLEDVYLHLITPANAVDPKLC